MICLKTRTFAVSQTTVVYRNEDGQGLWFAWKLVLLQYRKQLKLLMMWIVLRCDLLENSYFCSIANNNSLSNCTFITVVICLKTRTFAVSQTTVRILIETKIPLWFAWKLVLLQYRKQRPTISNTLLFRCDLLENSYFCSIANNLFHLCCRPVQLWFAWKLVLLQYRKQPMPQFLF